MLRGAEKKEKLPLRLLNLDQYLSLADGMKSLASEDDGTFVSGKDYHTYYPSVEAYERFWEYKTVENIKEWTFCYNGKPLPWQRSKCGLNVVRSPYFSEWLAPIGRAINAWGFCPPNDYMFANRYIDNPTCGDFGPSSDGTYKGMKIGFRLCYLADELEGKS